MSTRTSPPMTTNPTATQPVTRYTRTAMTLHWLTALGMICNVALALTVDYLPDDWIRPVIDTHKSIGITVLGLAVLRILWRISHRPPEPPQDAPRWERAAAHVAHVLLYVLIFALPISGWLHDSAWKDAATHPMSLFHVVPWFRINFIMDLPPAQKEHLHDVFGAIHTSFAYMLYVVLLLHILGALKHKLIDRESALSRMLP